MDWDEINPSGLLKHLELQSQALLQSHQATLDDLRRLQIEEEILMRTLYDIMSSEGLTTQKEAHKIESNVQSNNLIECPTALLEDERNTVAGQDEHACDSLIAVENKNNVPVNSHGETHEEKASLQLVPVETETESILSISKKEEI